MIVCDKCKKRRDEKMIIVMLHTWRDSVKRICHKCMNYGETVDHHTYSYGCTISFDTWAQEGELHEVIVSAIEGEK